MPTGDHPVSGPTQTLPVGAYHQPAKGTKRRRKARQLVRRRAAQASASCCVRRCGLPQLARPVDPPSAISQDLHGRAPANQDQVGEIRHGRLLEQRTRKPAPERGPRNGGSTMKIHRRASRQDRSGRSPTQQADALPESGRRDVPAGTRKPQRLVARTLTAAPESTDLPARPPGSTPSRQRFRPRCGPHGCRIASRRRSPRTSATGHRETTAGCT